MHSKFYASQLLVEEFLFNFLYEIVHQNVPLVA
jgi:hypothetical protein